MLFEMMMKGGMGTALKEVVTGHLTGEGDLQAHIEEKEEALIMAVALAQDLTGEEIELAQTMVLAAAQVHTEKIGSVLTGERGLEVTMDVVLAVALIGEEGSLLKMEAVLTKESEEAQTMFVNEPGVLHMGGTRLPPLRMDEVVPTKGRG